MTAKVFNNNDMGQNVYLYFDETNGEGVLVDAGCSDADAGGIAALVDEKGIVIKMVLLTHGHYDHIMGVYRIKQFTTAEVCCHEAEGEALENAEINRSAIHGINIEVTPDNLLADGDEIKVGNAILRVLHTPGHTPGCVCFYDEAHGNLFSGDTLFKETIGRTDFPSGSHEELIRHLKAKLLTLSDDTRVYPGHGGSTSIEHEKKFNPFVNR
jgi:glyoxylase-like metal-dependent hydrolase (beta-lactamase superfamily II)